MSWLKLSLDKYNLDMEITQLNLCNLSQLLDSYFVSVPGAELFN